MCDYKELFRTTETQNWFKCALALQITKIGLLKFITEGINQCQSHCIQSVSEENKLSSNSVCSSCTTQDVLPCPTKDICFRRKNRSCSFHAMPPRIICPNGICDRLVDKIKTEHRYSSPSWLNTNALKWCSSSWEFAKCYFPKDGYEGISSPKETDFNGIISVVINCKRFDRFYKSRSSKSGNICEQVNCILIFCYKRIDCFC